MSNTEGHEDGMSADDWQRWTEYQRAQWAAEDEAFATLRSIADVAKACAALEWYAQHKVAEARREIDETCLDAIWHSLRDQPDDKLTRHAQGIRDALRAVQQDIDGPERWFPIDSEADALDGGEGGDDGTE